MVCWENSGKPFKLSGARLSWAKWRGITGIYWESLIIRKHCTKALPHGTGQASTSIDIYKPRVCILAAKNKGKKTHKWLPHNTKILACSKNSTYMYH